MEGDVIERRTSSAALWGDARQQTDPTPSTSQSLTTTPVAVPAYSNIFVTPPTEAEQRPPLVKTKEQDNPDIPASKLSQIKDKHDGEIQNFYFVSNWRPHYCLLFFALNVSQWFRNVTNLKRTVYSQRWGKNVNSSMHQIV